VSAQVARSDCGLPSGKVMSAVMPTRGAGRDPGDLRHSRSGSAALDQPGLCPPAWCMAHVV